VVTGDEIDEGPFVALDQSLEQLRVVHLDTLSGDVRGVVSDEV
jgi:hypothetical protein